MRSQLLIPLLLMAAVFGVAMVVVLVLGEPEPHRSLQTPGVTPLSNLKPIARRSSLDMPAGAYGRSRGEWGLLNPKRVELDDALRKLSTDYAQLSGSERALFRSDLAVKDMNTLVDFARRSAVFGLRNRDPVQVREGLQALAIIERVSEKPDAFFDALAFLHFAIEGLGMEWVTENMTAAGLASADTKDLFTKFLHNGGFKDQAEIWKYKEVNTDAGVGFIEWDREPFEPTVDLVGLTTNIAGTLEADVYVVSQIKLDARKFPDYLLKGSDDDSVLNGALEGVVASTSLVALHEEDGEARAGSRMIMVISVELKDESAAQALVTLSRAKTDGDTLLGLASGRLYTLIVGRTVTGGKPQRGESPARFADALQAALDHHAASVPP